MAAAGDCNHGREWRAVPERRGSCRVGAETALTDLATAALREDAACGRIDRYRSAREDAGDEWAAAELNQLGTLVEDVTRLSASAQSSPPAPPRL